MRLRSALERAAGSGVWVKGAAGAFPPRRADAAVEALVVASAYEPALQALRKASEAQGLDSRVEAKRLAGGLRLAEVDLTRHGQPVGRWRVREVRQLLRAAIVIDDLGQNLEPARRLLRLPYSLTFSVLPRLAHSREMAEAAHHAGREVMLHLPMEPAPGSRAAPGDGALRVGMPRDEVIALVRSDAEAVPYARGANNHMGSLATKDPALMAPVMKVLAERHMYFVDSRTTSDTVALEVARKAGIPAFYRSVFLDNTETAAYSLGQLRELCRLVREQGVALAIGHPYPSTVAALTEFLPELERQDIQLVPASELVRLPEVARLSPPKPPEYAKKGQ